MAKQQDQRRSSKPVTKAYLERAALHYLGRFSSTRANLIQVLERKIRRRNEENSAPTTEQMEWADSVAEKCVAYGYVDDALYARQRMAALLRKGKPLRVIAQDLRHKGVADDIAQDAFAEAQEDPGKDLDLLAAASYMRRRRFGAFRRNLGTTDDKVEKEKAAMMRAGFPYKLVTEVMAASEEDLLNLLP